MRLPTTLALALLTLCPSALAQQSPPDIKILTPTVDKAAPGRGGTVTLPGAFWNEHVADWLDVAFCGRPSDFLHETVICSTTTRSLLEQSLRDIGCHDGDAWVDGVKDFPRIRGDHLLVLVTFGNAGVSPAGGGAPGGGAGAAKTETWSLDELITFSNWNVPLGPYGFMFKGDPDHAAAKPAATGPIATPLADSAQILRDDPQIALVFRGIQSMSQSFADHPLAYVEDRWEWPEIHRARNHSALPAAVFDSNGKIPVTLTFQKVTEEQLLTASAKVWHDDAFKAYMLQQMDTAKRLDKNKAEFWSLRQKAAALQLSSPRFAPLAAEIEKDYATLDAAWSTWAADHLKPDSDDPQTVAFVKDQARRWAEFVSLNQQRAAQLALAEEASSESAVLDPAAPDTPARRAALQGRAIEARSRALIAENKQSRDYWQSQWDKLDNPAPDDVWAKTIRLHITLEDARLQSGAAGIAYGQSLQAAPRDPAQEAALQKALDTAVRQMTLADARLSLATIEFEISKRQGPGPQDPGLPALEKQRATLQAKIQDLESPPNP